MKKILITTALMLLTSIGMASTEQITISGNAVVFEDVVAADSVDKAIAELTELENKGVNPIYFVINSPGGSVLAGATLITHIKNSKSEIVTICRQVCASMGFHLLQSGKRRLSYENAVIMSHPASGGMQGTLPEMRTQLTAFEKLVGDLDRFAAKRIGVDYKEWAFRNLENMWYTGTDAVKNNFVDGLAVVRYATPSDSIISIETTKEPADESENKLGKQVYSFE